MLLDGIASYVDVTMVQGVLSGVIVASAAVTVRYMTNRLWQKSLIAESEPALRAAEAAGLRIRPLGFGPIVQAQGVVGLQAVRVRWRGGVLGARTSVWVDGRRTALPLLRTAAALNAAIGLEE